MAVKATILLDGDKLAKRPFGVRFSDAECDATYGKNGLNNRDECYQCIEAAKQGGYEIDECVDNRFYLD